MSDYKVTAYIHSEASRKGRGIAGKMVLVTHDHTLASMISDSFAVPNENYSANVDFEVRVPINRRTLWLDANPMTLEHASLALMQAAEDIRAEQRKPLNVGSIHHKDKGNGHDHDGDVKFID